MAVTVKHSRRAAFTDAFAIIAEGWNELVQDGLTPDRVGQPPIDEHTQVIYAVGIDGDIVGVLLFRVWELRGFIDLTMSYVEPSSRRRGVFRTMLNDLMERGRERGVSRIVANVDIGNASYRKALSDVKAQETTLVYEIDL